MRKDLADKSLRIARGDTLLSVIIGPTPKQDPSTIPEPGPEGAELISCNLQYLAGITEDLSGWTLWKRIEDGREHRFAIDAAGAVRWERWYLIEPRLTLAAVTDQGHKTEI